MSRKSTLGKAFTHSFRSETPAPATEAAVVAPTTEAKPEEAAAVTEKKEEGVSLPESANDIKLTVSQPKAIKSSRRISQRFMQGFKNFGKKDAVTPKEEKSQAAAEAKPEEPAPVAAEAPQLEKPVAAEPLALDEVRQNSPYP